MGYRILRFFGALVTIIIFIFLVGLFHLVCMDYIVKLGTKSTLVTMIFSLDLYRLLMLFLIFLVWTIFYEFAKGIGWIVRGSKVIAALPLICLLGSLVRLFYILFINNSFLNDVGGSVWYYFCAIITFLVILGWWSLCVLLMFTYYKDQKALESCRSRINESRRDTRNNQEES